MCNESILKKVRALFARTVERGSTPQEAETALLLATQLMRKYQIDKKDVELSPSEFDISTIIVFKHRQEGDKWEKTLLANIANANLCHVVQKKIGGSHAPGGIEMTVVGKGENREVVLALFNATVNFIRPLYKPAYKVWKKEKIKTLARRLTLDFIKEAWKKFERERVVPSRYLWVKSYLIGVCAGVKDRLAKQAVDDVEGSNAYGIIKVKHDDIIKKLIQDRFSIGKPRKMKQQYYNSEAFGKGMQDGGIDPSQNLIETSTL